MTDVAVRTGQAENAVLLSNQGKSIFHCGAGRAKRWPATNDSLRQRRAIASLDPPYFWKPLKRIGPGEQMNMGTTYDIEPIRRPSLAEAQTAAHAFLMATLTDVFRVDVTKIIPMHSGEIAWEAEAIVWQPNAALKSLGLEAGRPVLDHSQYLLRLDSSLNVLEYESEDG